MQISVLSATEMSDEHFAVWSRLQRCNAHLRNPFFRPEFTLTVAAERDDVEVAIWEQSGEPVGFLPFERSGANVGRPIGSHINLFQGAIARSDVDWSPREIVRAAGLRGWRFDHLLATQTAFTPFQCAVADSPYLDLSQGFEHYRKSRGKSAANFISHIMQKDRKAGRELGDVRLEINRANRATLARLLSWKIDQCRQRKRTCIYEVEWVVRLHERLLDYSTDDFAGSLFSLYMGDRLASAFFCLRSGNVLQGSILGFDAELGPYAPGLVLLMRVAQAASSLGITRIDLGSGEDEYKHKLASACERVADGTVPSQRLILPIYRGMSWAKDRLRSTRLRGPLRRLKRWMFLTRLRLGCSD
jgi:CelD/BcsL family acetyltransferase involved in cellulose biosynthesis